MGHFYHVEGGPFGGQDLIYVLYADEKSAYQLTFRLYEKQDEDNQDRDTNYDPARGIVTEFEEEVGVRKHTFLFNSWLAHDSGLFEYIESYNDNQITPFQSNRKVTYCGEETSVDALAERI